MQITLRVKLQAGGQELRGSVTEGWRPIGSRSPQQLMLWQFWPYNSTSGDPEEDLLGITGVHPMREDAIRELLRGSGSSWSVVERLSKRGELEPVEYHSHRFYVRRFPRTASVDQQA